MLPRFANPPVLASLRLWTGLACALTCTWGGWASAQAGNPPTPAAAPVQLSGLAAGRALLAVDGEAPRFVSPGQTVGGVKLLSVGPGHAVVEHLGQRETLTLGQSPLRPAPAANASATDKRIVLTADSGGHFTTPGQINGQRVQFLVDTGATVVVISETEAQRIGLNYRSGPAARVKTANGETQGFQLQITQLRINGHTAYNVPAVVLPAQLPFVLLGNSYLSRFDMRRENDRMVLEARN
ncbi:MAG: hypothetical protein RL323_1043 [Pseudomonadota bacterium]